MADEQPVVQNKRDAEMAEASDSSSSDDSDFEELSVGPEDAKLLMELEKTIQDNPTVYDNHVQYIEVLRRCKMAERLREARQAMHAAFPLTEPLWFDWLSDEIDAVAEAEDIERIEGLFDAAVMDYLSIPLWTQYLEFVRDFDPEVQAGSKEGQGKMRDLCERALTAGGLHIADGSRLWGIYREYQQALAEAAPSEEQIEQVRALWGRQLQVPLADAAQTLAAYEAWERGQPGGASWQLPASLRSAYDKACHAAELRQPYEESVAAGREANADLLAGYMAYVKVEERLGDPGRVQVAYERAIAAFPVTHYLWAQYARYLESHLKINSVVNAVYARSVRNCPWVGQLWGRALRALERSGAPEEQHKAMFDKSLGAGLQSYEDFMEPLLARLDYLRRQCQVAGELEAPLPLLRATFQRASDLFTTYFPKQMDQTFRLTSYWAECEAGLGGDLKAARGVWEAALKGTSGRYADTWAAFIAFERKRGNTREARTLYKRSYSRRLEEGGQAVLCEAWVRFEREEGSAEDHLLACLKVEPILQELQAAAAAAADPLQHAVAKAAVEKAPKLLSKEEMREMRQAADPNYAKRKAQQAQQAKQAERAAMPPPPGKRKQAGTQGQQAQRDAMPPPPAKKPRTAASGAGNGAAPAGASAGPAAVAQPQQQQGEQQQQQAESEPVEGTKAGTPQQQQGQQEQQGQQQRRAPLPGAEHAWRQQRRTDSNTAFVKHLADGVDEAALQELFGKCGAMSGIELGRDKQTGRIKGFAYIHFASPKGLEAACQLDRAEFRGKHIFVAPSKPPAGGGAAPPGGQQQGGQQQQQQGGQPQQQQQGGGRGHGGRDGGRGGRDGGRGGRDGGRGGRDGGRGGRDGGRGRGGGRGAAPGPKHRSMIDLGNDQPGGGPRGFVPRAAALGGQQQQQQGGSGGVGPAAGEAPKSNAEFRAMFLKK